MSSLILSPKEQERLDKFAQEHKKCKPMEGKFTFLITGTGLGEVTEIRCNSCGKTKNITDISEW